MGFKPAQAQGQILHVISLSQEDDIALTTSLSNSEEGFALAVQPATSQPVGTRSEKWYLRQYDQTLDEIQQPTTLRNVAPA